MELTNPHLVRVLQEERLRAARRAHLVAAARPTRPTGRTPGRSTLPPAPVTGWLASPARLLRSLGRSV